MKNLTLARGLVKGWLTYHFEEARRFPNDINREMIDADEFPADPETLLSVANITKAIIREFEHNSKAFPIITISIVDALASHRRSKVCHFYASQLSEHDARTLKIIVEYSPGFRKMLNGVHSTIRAQQLGLKSVTAVVIPFAFAKKHGEFSDTIQKIDKLAEQTKDGSRWDRRIISHLVGKLLGVMKKIAPSTLDYKRMRREVEQSSKKKENHQNILTDQVAQASSEGRADVLYWAPHPDAGCGTLFTPDTIRSDKKSGPTHDQRLELLELSLVRFFSETSTMKRSPIDQKRPNASFLEIWERYNNGVPIDRQWFDRLLGKAKNHTVASEIFQSHSSYTDLISLSAVTKNFTTYDGTDLESEIGKILRLFSLALNKVRALHEAKRRIELYARGEIKPNLAENVLIDLVPKNFEGEKRGDRAMRVTNVTFIERELFGTKPQQTRAMVSPNDLLLLALHMDVNPADLWLEFRHIHPACEFMRVLGNMSRGHDSVMTPDMASAYLTYQSYAAARAKNYHTDYWNLVQLWWLETFPRFPEIQQQFNEQCERVIKNDKSAGIGVRPWGIPFLKLDAAEEARALNRTIV